MDRMAADTIYFLSASGWFCAHTSGRRKYHPIGIAQKGKKNILDELYRFLCLERSMYLLGVQCAKRRRLCLGVTGNYYTLFTGAAVNVNLHMALLPAETDY
jgi:hypothetical protein